MGKLPGTQNVRGLSSSINDPIAWGLASIMLSSLGLGIGGVILEDDAGDIGEFSTPEHPSPLHHWQLGLGIIIASTIGLLLSTLYAQSQLMNKERYSSSTSGTSNG